MRHLKGTIKYSIDRRTFYLLCVNFCLLEHATYSDAMEKGYVTLSQLAKMARTVGLPYMLFFVSFDRVNKLIGIQNEELFGRLDDKYIMGARGKRVDIRWIRRIILDLSRKQKLYSHYNPTKRLDKVVGYLKNSKRTSRDQADYILEVLGININYFRHFSKKSDAFKYLREQLSKQNIHVSVEARNYMPQSIPEQIKGTFSGVYIRDPKNPTLFICNELSGSPEMGSGRKIYTLMFLLVCLFKDKSYAVSISRNTYKVDKKKHSQFAAVHEIVNEILMPSEEVKSVHIEEYAQLEKFANKYNVTPRAALQRLYDARIIREYTTYRSLADECARRFSASVKKNKEKKGGGAPGADIMISYYQGDFLSFVNTYVPPAERGAMLRKHVSFNRLHGGIEGLV